MSAAAFRTEWGPRALVALPCQHDVGVWVAGGRPGGTPLYGIDLFAVSLQVMDTRILLHTPDLDNRWGRGSAGAAAPSGDDGATSFLPGAFTRCLALGKLTASVCACVRACVCAHLAKWQVLPRQRNRMDARGRPKAGHRKGRALSRLLTDKRS